jgi:predicted SAM-dependent methyltransferase
VKRGPIRIIIGAAGTHERGWISTDIQCLNLLKPDHWRRVFKPSSIDAILAEHVWEHLTIEEGLIAAQRCYTYLKPGGYIRVAVPDGLHPDPKYLEYVKIGGTGCGAKDHKVLYTYKSLKGLFETAGFNVTMLEYFDDAGKFHQTDWNPADGKIHRSRSFDERNKNGLVNYTSIILDAKRER